MPDRHAAPHVAVVAAGVSGLAAAVNLLDQAAAAGRDLRVTLFEKSTEPGGNLQTLRVDGWQIEWGPNGFLDNEPATLRLVDRLGLGEQLQRSRDAARRRFLLVGGRLREIPGSPGAFLRSDLLGWRAKLRVAGELFVPARDDLDRAAERPASDETIDAFGRRRLGAEFAEILLDPMVKGIYGGNSRRLSLAAAFPRMVELERDYGGLFRAMFALARQRKREGRPSGGGGGPSGILHSFRGGMGALIAAATAALDADERARVRRGTAVARLTRREDGWYVGGDRFEEGPFAAVIDAAPSHAAAEHLRSTAPAVAARLAEISFAPLAVIALGFDRAKVRHELDGFGLLIPSRERRRLLGVLWTSSIFDGRAPAEKVLLRAMAGGADAPRLLDLDDRALVELALDELGPLLGLQGTPALARVIRHPRAIAQYEPGHLARLAAIERGLTDLPGLYLTGASYRGISVNACAKEAETVAAALLAALPVAVPASAEAGR